MNIKIMCKKLLKFKTLVINFDKIIKRFKNLIA